MVGSGVENLFCIHGTQLLRPHMLTDTYAIVGDIHSLPTLNYTCKNLVLRCLCVGC